MPSPRRPRLTGSPLTADHPVMQALIAALIQLSPKELGGMVRFHIKVMSIPKRPRAGYFREFMPEEPDEQIAAMVGVNRTTLYEWPEYVEAVERLERVFKLKQGFIDGKGEIEAW